jgi:hypothetical protein
MENTTLTDLITTPGTPGSFQHSKNQYPFNTIFTMSFSSFPIFQKLDTDDELPFETATHASSSAVNQSDSVHHPRGRPPVYSSDAERTQARREKTAGRLRRYRSVSRIDLWKLHPSPTEQYTDTDTERDSERDSQLEISDGEDNTCQVSGDECFSNAELILHPNNQLLPSELSVEIPDWVIELPLPHPSRGGFLMKIL